MSTTTTTTVTLQETVPLSFNTTIEPNEAREDTINDTNTHVEANNVPESWRRNYRRVPSRRPANPELDQSERPYGANPLEYTFISVMMQGVAMQSVSLVQKPLIDPTSNVF